MMNKQDLSELTENECVGCDFFIPEKTQWGNGILFKPLCWLKTYRKDLLSSKCKITKPIREKSFFSIFVCSFCGHEYDSQTNTGCPECGYIMEEAPQ